MKINRNQLMQIIKEEVHNMRTEEADMGAMPELDKLFQDAKEIARTISTPDMDIDEYGMMYNKLLTLLMKKRGLGEYEEEKNKALHDEIAYRQAYEDAEKRGEA
tara:strand:- start:3139 stop:3450 length:312 start_codon:yes stop_codon:yes gene_type:complete